MSTVRQGLVLAIALSTVAFTSTAMAGQGEIRARPPLPRVRLALTPPARVRTGHLGKAIQQSCPRDNDTIRIVC